ncbi:hypothetical protein [Bradyrhizobium genosp. P]|uniref:hypothetical protein n=1 Tax=Bradyrhizobium genosp. P TaxID=83641 RepID=UPI003CFB7032
MSDTRLKVVQCDPPDLFDLGPLVCDAAGLSAALAMAIQGVDTLAMDDEHQRRALEYLASEAMYAAEKARELWCEIIEARGIDHAAQN